MINHRKKASWSKIPQYDPTFYNRFRRAWTNFQENEVEARLHAVIAEPKAQKNVLDKVFR